jgi:hypothetical protein
MATAVPPPPAREPISPEPVSVAEGIANLAPRQRSPVESHNHDASADEESDDGDGEYDSGVLQRRRASRERERVARRKLLTKLAVVAVLAVVTLFTVRAAINHVDEVAEHNATIRGAR